MDIVKIYTFLQQNMGITCTILFLIMSELMSWKPVLGSYGISKFLYNVFRGEARKAKPDIVKLIDSEMTNAAELRPPDLTHP